MPRICPKCGANLPAGSGVCPSCGHGAEDDVQIFTPHNTAPPDAKLRARITARRIAAAAVCAAVVAAGSFALWRISRENTPEKAVGAFQSALAAGDFEQFCAVAEPAGGTVFTEQSLAPMFSLYRESAAFRQQTALLSSEDSPCLRLEKRGSFPFATYRVMVDACKLDVVSNIASADVTVGSVSAQTQPLESAGEPLDGTQYPQDFENLVRSSAEFDTLLPGLYDLDVSYTSSLGQSFSGSTSVSLMQPTQTELDLDYTSLYVWNSSSMDVALYVDGAPYGTLSSGSALQLAPLHADAVVQASCTTDAGETLTDSVTASSRSFEIQFSLGTVDVYNDYNADMSVQLGGSDYCVIPAKTLQTISGISLGSTLTFSLADSEIFSPYDYQLVYDYDSVCPILDLSEESELAVSAIVQDELTTAPLTGADDGLLSSLDRLLVKNGWSRSEVVVSDVTVENVYAMEPQNGGMLLRLSGYFTCTNITLPDASAPLPEPDETVSSDEDGTDGSLPDAPDSDTPLPASVQNPQYTGFYVSVFYDGENWSIAE